MPTIPEDVLPREKNVIVQEYRDKWSYPQQRFYRESYEFLFGKDHPYVRDGLGQPEYIKKITAQKLRAIRAKYIVPANLFIGIAGKVDPKEVKVGFEQLLTKQLKGSRPKMVDKPVSSKKHYLFHKEDVEHAVIYVDWLIPGYDDLSPKEEETFRLAKYILGGSPRSLLYYELRQKMGIAYSGGASVRTFPKKGFFEAYTSTDHKNITNAITTIEKVVTEFIKNGVSASRFYQSKKFADMQLLLSYDSIGGIANSITYDLFYFDRIIPLKEHRKILSSISQKDMLKFIKKYLSEKPYISIMAKKKPDL